MGCFKFNILALLFIASHFSLWSQNANKGRTLFGEGVISTENVEYGCTFSADGTEVYFVRSPDPWGSSNSGSTIYHSQKVSGQWSEPEIASFSGQHKDSDPFLTPDGNRLYFISNRGDTADIWWVEKEAESGWGKPQRLPDPINSDAREYSPRTDHSGTLYFASDRPSGFGQGDIYMSRMEQGQFQEPENLGQSINSSTGEWNLEISGDGMTLLFEASGREENLSPYGDLYISFRVDDEWSVARNIKEINTGGSDLYALLRENGSLLYYSSSDSLRSKNTNIYSIPFADILKEYRKNAELRKK